MATCTQGCSALAVSAARLLVSTAILLSCLGGVSDVRAQDSGQGTASPGALPFRPAPPLRSYVAIRRLQSSNERHNKEAWMVARTELRPDGTFAYEVLEEGGSELIRKRVLHEALEKEAEVHRLGRARRGGLTHENYQFAPPSASGDMVRIGLTPRRKEELLVKGTMLTSPDGELLQVEGELVKRPSFWTRSVYLVRHYGRIAGTQVPVRLDMRAQIRLVGTSTLTCLYEYLAINGQPVADLRQSSGAARGLTVSRAPSSR